MASYSSKGGSARLPETNSWVVRNLCNKPRIITLKPEDRRSMNGRTLETLGFRPTMPQYSLDTCHIKQKCEGGWVDRVVTGGMGRVPHPFLFGSDRPHQSHRLRWKNNQIYLDDNPNGCMLLFGDMYCSAITILRECKKFTKQSRSCFGMFEQCVELLLGKIELLSKMLLHCVIMNIDTHCLGWSL